MGLAEQVMTWEALGSQSERSETLAESVYKIIELVGTSTESWEKAATAAVERAGSTLRDLRIAEVAALDMHIEEGKVASYRAKVKLSFKYED
jgi:flavin-binding protein dodecin